MFIRCMLLGIALTAVAGCGMAGNRVSNAQESLDTATITGIVSLPEGVAASDACGAMSIQALQGGAAIGRSQVRESRGRCWYELSRLPADVDVTVRVSPPACSGGKPASLTPTEEPVRLRKDETRTRDFRATCALATPADHVARGVPGEDPAVRGARTLRWDTGGGREVVLVKTKN